VIMEAPSRTRDLLAVKDLAVSLGSKKRRVRILHGVSIYLAPGECLSLVGESGCGKTMTALSILRLLPAPGGRIDAGENLYLGEDLVKASESRLRAIRGHRITLISQDAQTALNPYLRVSEQLVEGLMHHKGTHEKEALEQGITMLESVGIPGARERVHDYPHRFSGGMLQRIMIAMALMTSPDLIIADEPTSALDVTIQAQTLKLLDDLRASTGAAVLLITHDLGIVAGRSDRIAVMYAGRIVEHGNTARVLKSPGHPYMKALLASNPSVHQGKDERLKEIPGQPPRPGAAPPGCAFAPRCPHAMDRCKKEIPPLMDLEEGHEAACWLV
jgi:oligopeptide/dipeptide ABC transporter ATP-binding protein